MNEYSDFVRSIRDTESPPSVGTFLKSGSPLIAEACGTTPLEFLVLDCQHANYDFDDLEHVLRAAELADLPVLVRPPVAHSEQLVNILDAGAHGLVLPQIETAEDVRTVVDAVTYRGSRSFAMSTRAGEFGSRDRSSYVDFVNDSLLVVPMVESATGLENVDDIVAVEGVDAVMVGPADLSQDCGFERGSTEFDDATEDVRAAAGAAGIGFGIYVGDPDDVSAETARSSFVVCGSEVSHMAAGLDGIAD